MVEFTWKLKDKKGKIYTRRHLSFLMREYINGEIDDGDLLFQSDETKPWVEIRNLKSLFQSIEREDISKTEKLISKKILDAHTYHITFLLIIFIVMSLFVIHLGFPGRIFPSFFKNMFNIRSKVICIAGTLLIISILLFLPLTLFYASLNRWKGKLKKFFLQQERYRDDEDITLQKVEKLTGYLSASLKKNSLIRSILDSALKTSQFSAAFLLLRNYQLNRIVYESGLKIDRTMFKKTEFNFDEAGIKEVIRSKEIIWILDVDKKEFNYFLRPEKFQVLGKADSLALIPLVIGEEVLGILGLYGTRDNFIQFRQLPFLASILKNQASLALGSAIQSELAILDRLTGLLNHEYFMMRLNEEVERSRRFHLVLSFLMIDLDHFKRINDTYGHQAGDQILKGAASILNENIRVVDFCGRYGGEEFAMVLIDTGIEGAEIKAEQVRKTIEDRVFKFDSQTLKITASVGVSAWRWPDDKEVSTQNLIKKTDKELYRAKNEGRNRICLTIDGKPVTRP